MNKEDIENLDDLAQYFFEVAKEVGIPLKDIKLIRKQL